MRRTSWLTCALALSLMPLLALGERSGGAYHWIDEAGRTYYGDTLPPEAADQRRSSEAARRPITTLDDTLRALARPLAERQREAEQASRDKRDRELLRTFAHVDEIRTLRAQRLDGVDARINLLRQRLRQLRRERERLVERRERSDEAHRRAELDARIDEVDAASEPPEARLAAERNRRARIEARFDADIARFRELEGDDAAR